MTGNLGLMGRTIVLVPTASIKGSLLIDVDQSCAWLLSTQLPLASLEQYPEQVVFFSVEVTGPAARKIAKPGRRVQYTQSYKTN